jgi:hypothetical protein
MVRTRRITRSSTSSITDVSVRLIMVANVEQTNERLSERTFPPWFSSTTNWKWYLAI